MVDRTGGSKKRKLSTTTASGSADVEDDKENYGGGGGKECIGLDSLSHDVRSKEGEYETMLRRMQEPIDEVNFRFLIL